MSGASERKNRLAGESSPYLLLHASNPVDWYPWGAEALEKARQEDKPIFLSIGYSTCYWCHVMERESFSNAAVAEAMNREFVNIKVDREERPDLDELYMIATQVLNEQGGWPNSVFLTPDLKPFFAGTYFPPQDVPGRPGFPTVLASMVLAWKDRRSDVLDQAELVADALRRHLEESPAASGPPSPSVVDSALSTLRQRFDATYGGFGGAPKFPTPSNLFLLDEIAAETPAARMMLAATLDAMARGGIYDQLGGGFHRYATDREWRVPHFEKMLYDNAFLLELYAREHARSGDPESRRIVEETIEFLAREMTSPEGAFWSAIDAETDEIEGAFYAWTREELTIALGPEDAKFLAPIYGFDGEPFFEDGGYVLHLPRPLDVCARERRTTREKLLAEIAPLRERLFLARSRRKRPATDDKVLADWNGMMIAALATAGRLLARPDWIERAGRAAIFALEQLRDGDGVLLHSWRGGTGRIRAYLSDYVYLVRGCLALAEATGEKRRWVGEAERLQDEQSRRLASPQGGYFNVGEAPDLLYRGKEVFDGAVPAANAVAALNVIALAGATGKESYLDEAGSVLRGFAGIVETIPAGARMMAIAARRYDLLRPAPAGAAAATPVPANRPSGDQVRLGLELSLGDLDSEGWRALELTVELPAAWHFALGGPGSAEVPLRLAGSGVEVRDVVLPPAEPLTSAEATIRTVSGRFEITARARASKPEDPEAERWLVLHFQACDDRRCLPPASARLRFE